MPIYRENFPLILTLHLKTRLFRFKCRIFRIEEKSNCEIESPTVLMRTTIVITSLTLMKYIITWKFSLHTQTCGYWTRNLYTPTTVQPVFVIQLTLRGEKRCLNEKNGHETKRNLKLGLAAESTFYVIDDA